MTYSEKLRDPRWQKKRLEILQRDDFSCQWCGNDEDTLHVHHLIYTKADPWDEPEEHLMTVCENCHTDEHSKRDDYEKLLIKNLRKVRFPAYSIKALAHSFNNLTIPRVPEVIMSAICHVIKNDHLLREAINRMFIDFSEKHIQ